MEKNLCITRVINACVLLELDGEAVLTDPQVQAAIGADHYVASLHAAVTTCLEEANKVAGSAPQVTVAA